MIKSVLLLTNQKAPYNCFRVMCSTHSYECNYVNKRANSEWSERWLDKNGQNYQISVFCSKSVFRYGGITSQIFRELAALEPAQK